MSGYSAGLLGFRSTEIDDSRVAAALAVSPWRGRPTSSHVTGVGQVYALGEASSAQEDGVSIVLHGRIDRLPNADADIPTGNSGHDTCLALIEAYRRDGAEFVDRLTGDFAIILVDERDGSMLATRDWLGTRPLFWGRTERGLAFASEVQQVLALLDAPYRLDEDTLETHARMDDPPVDATFALGVKAVVPGGLVVARASGYAETRRFRVRFPPVALPRASADETVRQRLELAVGRRTRGALHLGGLVSGGMDSTAVMATAASLAARGAGPPPVAALTFAYRDDPQSDETALASAVAARWGIPWHLVETPPGDFATWPDVGFDRHLGPTATGFATMRHMSETARRAGVDVLLSGELGDYWLIQTGSELRLSILRGDLRGIVAWGLAGARANPRRTAGQLYRGLQGRLRGDRAEAYFERHVDSWIRWNLEMKEREAMFHGIRIEFPFADRDLVTLLAGVPPSRRSSPGTDKLITRRAMRGLLPMSVLERTGYSIIDPWLNAAMGPRSGGDTSLPLAAATRRYADAWRSRSADSVEEHVTTEFTTNGGS